MAATAPSRTLAGPVAFEGVGLFTPARSTTCVRSAPAGHGIHFKRIDLPGQPGIPARADRTVAKDRQTVLAAHISDQLPPSTHSPHNPSDPTVQTVEHLLSALWGLGITDALIEQTGPEIPILDGSAVLFATAFRQAGVVEQPGGHGSPARVAAPITFADRGASIEAFPLADDLGPRLEIEYRLDYGPGAPIAAHAASFALDFAAPDVDAYLRLIAPARTFCTEAEARVFRTMGLFAHLGPRDVLVIGPHGAVDNTLRFPDEPARHKVLDLIGDLSLAGRPIHARIVATRSGHALNQQLARALASL